MSIEKNWEKCCEEDDGFRIGNAHQKSPTKDSKVLCVCFLLVKTNSIKYIGTISKLLNSHIYEIQRTYNFKS